MDCFLKIFYYRFGVSSLGLLFLNIELLNLAWVMI